MTSTFYVHDGLITDEDRRRLLTAARRWARGERSVSFMRPNAPLIYLSGKEGPQLRPYLRRPDLGIIAQPGTTTYLSRARGRVAFDNGCYSAVVEGRPFDERGWRAGLDKADPRLILFAVAPDVPYDHAATWERSRPYLDLLRSLGYAAALAAQDGLTVENVPWGAFDVLFVGGSDPWKLGEDAHRLVLEARRRELWTHMGRVNTRGRLLYAHAIGCDSVDGTKLKHGIDANLPELLSWLDLLATPRLFPLTPDLVV